MDYSLLGSLEESMSALWFEVMQFLPLLVVAILVLVVGWIIGGILGSLVNKAFKKFHLDDALDKAGVDELSKRAGYAFKPGRFAGALVKWFIIIAFAVVAFDVLGLGEVTAFMREVVLLYLPQVFAAALILFVGVLVANLARNSLVAALRSTGTQNVDLFGKLAYALVIAFTIMAVLSQLQIADELVETLFMGIVFALSLALGLSFGLGGKDAAAQYIEQMTKKKHDSN